MQSLVTCVGFQPLAWHRLTNEVVLQQAGGLLRHLHRGQGAFLPGVHDLTDGVSIWRRMGEWHEFTLFFASISSWSCLATFWWLESLNSCKKKPKKANSQLPNLSGQAWPSIGKFIRRMGHSAFIVNLSRRGLKAAFDLYLINSGWHESWFQFGTGFN